MRALLRNKTVVTGLVVTALVFTVHSTFNRTRSGALNVSATVHRTVEPSNHVRLDRRPILGIELTLVRSEQGSWRQRPTRDPFSPRLIGASSTKPTNPRATNPPAAFVLQAISIEGSRTLAVINHQVVEVGDQINRFHVRRIEPDRVWLESEAQTYELSVQRVGIPGSRNRLEPEQQLPIKRR